MRVKVVRYAVSIPQEEAARLQYEITAMDGVYMAKVYPYEAEVVFFPDKIDEAKIREKLGEFLLRKLEEREGTFEDIVARHYRWKR